MIEVIVTVYLIGIMITIVVLASTNRHQIDEAASTILVMSFLWPVTIPIALAGTVWLKLKTWRKE